MGSVFQEGTVYNSYPEARNSLQILSSPWVLPGTLGQGVVYKLRRHFGYQLPRSKEQFANPIATLGITSYPEGRNGLRTPLPLSVTLVTQG